MYDLQQQEHPPAKLHQIHIRAHANRYQQTETQLHEVQIHEAPQVVHAAIPINRQGLIPHPVGRAVHPLEAIALQHGAVVHLHPAAVRVVAVVRQEVQVRAQVRAQVQAVVVVPEGRLHE